MSNDNEDHDDAELARMLNESGKREQLRDKLMRQLSDSGWRDQVRAFSLDSSKGQAFKHCFSQVKLVVLEAVHEKGAEHVAIEDLVQEVAPKATALVPKATRQALAKDIGQFLKENEY